MRQVIIFAPAHDVHASAVAWALRRTGVEVELSESVRSDPSTRLAVHAGERGLKAWASGRSLDALTSVWYRRPASPDLRDQNEVDRAFSSQQWVLFQKNFLTVAKDLLPAFWVNDPAAAVAAESKLLQLRVAAEVGLEFPEAVVTNDAGKVADLVTRWGRVVFKTFVGHAWEDRATQRMYNSDVAVLDASTELPELPIAFCPGIYQRYIDKVCDLRVTVIGDRFFAARISRRSGGAFIDWRPSILDEEMQVEAVQLPEVTELKLRQLMRRLGLVFGCIDLVVDARGQLYFLEVNQQGQFLFIEKMLPGFPLLQAVSSMLATGEAKYSLEPDPRGPTFEQYLESADYQRALAAPDTQPVWSYTVEGAPAG
jgi:glutathione synthase/RimK-type ligase-like ATP-grasp enzyme